MSGLGTMIAGGKGGRQRLPADFYPTPPAATWALIEAEREWLPDVGGRVWEPACGDGALAETLRAGGLDVVATDLHHRGYAKQLEAEDFLHYRQPLAPLIITNPPFALAAEFIRHALGRLKVRGLVLLLKATYWHAAERVVLKEEFPPVAEYPVAWRVDFTGEKNSTMDVTWFVWGGGPRRGHPLRRPNRLPDSLRNVWTPPLGDLSALDVQSELRL